MSNATLMSGMIRELTWAAEAIAEMQAADDFDCYEKHGLTISIT